MELFKIFGTLALMGVDKTNKQLDDVTGKAKGTQDKFSTACKKIGTAAAGAFAGDKIIQFGKDIVNTAGKSESSFAKVTTLLDTSKVNTKAYYDSVKRGAGESHVSISDFSEAMYQALSASVDAGDAVGFTTKAVKLAKAGFTDTSTAVDVMTTAINAYGLQAKDADHISDNLITTQNLGKTTVNELAQSMGRVIPTASAYGVNIDNLCSSYAIMTKSGIATAESTTYLKSMMNELGKEGSTVSDTLKAQTGKSFAECMASGMSLGDVLQVLSDSVGGNTTAFANLWQSQEAGTGALALVNAGAQEFNDTVKQMGNDAGTTSSAYEKIEGTAEAKTEALKAKFSNLKSELGEKLLPVFSKLVEVITNKVIPGFEKAGAFIEKHKTAFEVLAAVVAGAASAYGIFMAALAVGKIVSFVSTIMTAISMIKSFAGAMSLIKLAIAAAGGPVTLIIAAIGALVAAFVVLWNKSDAFRNFWKGLWSGLKNVVSAAVNGIKGFFGGIADRFKAVGDSIKEHGGGIKGTFSALGDHIKDSFGKGFKAAKLSSDTFWGSLKTSYEEGGGGLSGIVKVVLDKQNDLIRGAFTAIGNLFGINLDGIADKIVSFRQGIGDKVVGLIETVQNAVAGFFTGIYDKIAGFFTNVITAIGNFFSPAIEAIQAAWETIKNVVQVGIMFIEQLLNTAFQILTLPWQFIWQNFGDEITVAWEAIKSVVSTALDAIKTAISTVWNAIKAFMEPILNAIRTAVETAWNAIRTVTETVFNAIKTVIETVWNAVKTVTSTAWNSIKSTITAVINAIKSVVTSVFNAIKSVVTSIWNGVKSVTVSVWNGVKSAVSNAVNAIKSRVSNVFNSIKNVVSSVSNGIRSTTASVWNGIKSAITRPIEAARDAVHGAIERMKSFFHFSWSLPHLSLPHFSVSGSFSLNPPSVPHFGISWYKKAMEQPYLFTQPTIFGMNPQGQAMGAGEAGDEIMIGKNTMMNMIGSAVAENNDSVVQRITELFNALIELLNKYLPDYGNLQVVLDSGSLVGELAPQVDTELGNIARKKGRGMNY